MSCVACGKTLGFSNNGAKFCTGCSDAVHKQRKCEIAGCKSSTEAFYTHCTFHYHRLQREIRLAHARRQQPEQQPTSKAAAAALVTTSRPYRSSQVAPTVPARRRVSRSPSPIRPRQTERRTRSKSKQQQQQQPTPPPTPAAVVVAPEKVELTKPAVEPVLPRRVLKRTEPLAVAVAQQQPRKRPRQSTNPNVIVEYECGACAARNVVTREVRFLQTFVVRDGDAGADPDFPAASDYKFAADQRRDEDADREVDDILNCKDDPEFQVNISNALAAAAAAATTTK